MKIDDKNIQTRRTAFVTFSLLTLILVSAAVIYSCTKRNTAATSTEQTEAVPRLKTAGAQPLPQGKARFSVVLGNMDTSPWVRLGNWTFDASAGTVAATFWSWSYDDKHDVQILGSHTCTFDGVTKTVNTYTPYGWMEPGGIYQNWGGTYIYNTSTGRLDITWTSGAGAGNTESWDVSLPESGLARVKFVANSSTYHVTHGRGYGSNAPWPDASGSNHPAAFKTIDELPSISVSSTTGRHVVVSKVGGGTPTVSPTTANAWSGAAWGGSVGMTTPSAPTPKNCKHIWHSTADTPCDPAGTNPSCTTTRPGIIYHWSSKNNGRQMSWVNFCACLPSNTSWPGYGGNMHPQAHFQILDDSSVMKGVIGIETQNPPSTGPQSAGYPNFQMQLQDFTTVAGS